MVPPDDPEALREEVLKPLNRTKGEAAAATEKGSRRAEDFRVRNRIKEMVQLFNDTQEERF